MTTGNNVIAKGYTVVFNRSYDSSTGFVESLEKAQMIRDMVAGGGIIYHATLEKSGLNCFCVRGDMVRKSAGTPL